MARQPKVPPTPKIEDAPPPMVPPLELVVHAATMNVRHIPTPDGQLTVAQFMSPTGIMITLKFDEDGVAHLVSQLEGKPQIITATPGIIIP